MHSGVDNSSYAENPKQNWVSVTQIILLILNFEAQPQPLLNLEANY